MLLLLTALACHPSRPDAVYLPVVLERHQALVEELLEIEHPGATLVRAGVTGARVQVAPEAGLDHLDRLDFEVHYDDGARQVMVVSFTQRASAPCASRARLSSDSGRSGVTGRREELDFLGCALLFDP